MPDAPYSNRDVKRVANVSPPEIRPLRNSADFTRVLAEGRRNRSGGLVIVRSLGLSDGVRVGLIVSKSAGNAVTRNRIRRRLRHALRAQSFQPGNDYVIIASRQVADAPFERVRGWLGRGVELASRA